MMVRCPILFPLGIFLALAWLGWFFEHFYGVLWEGEIALALGLDVVEV
jgi:hypothetical protein